MGYAFKGICYNTLQGAAEALQSNYPFQNNTNYHVLTGLTYNADNTISFTQVIYVGNFGSYTTSAPNVYYTYHMSFPTCATSSEYVSHFTNDGLTTLLNSLLTAAGLTNTKLDTVAANISTSGGSSGTTPMTSPNPQEFADFFYYGLGAVLFFYLTAYLIGQVIGILNRAK